MCYICCHLVQACGSMLMILLLILVCAGQLSPLPFCMVQYCVYKASFYTGRGSRRCYIGMTGNPEQREADLQTKGDHQPAWLKAGCKQFQYNVLVDKIPSKAAALATEALMTAHEWRRAPDATRGGPWVRPKLSAGDISELRASSSCKSLQELLDSSFAKESGHLGVHLRGISLTSAVATSRPSQSNPRKDLDERNRISV